MAPVFSKEAILQGSIDHLCLVCESYLRSERDVCLHVATTTHKQHFESTHYVEQYSDDRIRKIKKWYYCEFCNILVNTITKVRLHVDEARHKDNVASQMITRVDDVIVCGNITITDEAWHGFINDNTCMICNVEFDDKVDHRSDPAHIINLIQSKVITDHNNTYRKIDDSTFHCLVCNTVVADISTHLEDANHKNVLKTCKKIKLLMAEEECNKINEQEGSLQSVNDKNKINDKNNPSSENVVNQYDVLKTSGNGTSIKHKDDENIDEHVITEIDENNYVICDGKTLCIRCNYDVDPLEMKTHLNSSHHQNMSKMQKADQINKDTKVNDNTSDILDSIPKFQKENININFESRTAVCRKCSINIDFDSKIIEEHIKKHKNNVKQKESANKQIELEKDEKIKPKDSGSLLTSTCNEKNVETKPTEKTKQNDNVIQKMAEEHDITYAGKKLYCRACNKYIPKSTKNINEHVNGDLHKTNAELTAKPVNNGNKKINAKKLNFQRVPLQQFIRLMTTVKSLFAEDVIINEKYCINLMAFTFLSMTSPGRLRCLVCEVNVVLQDMQNHLDTKRHERAMTEIPVIIHVDSEFIREIRSDVFQCGYCNIVGSWDAMEDHWKSTSHKESKTFANWRLSQHLPQIQQDRLQRQIHNEFFMRLMMS